jgi:opacity protein-like surface antigen
MRKIYLLVCVLFSPFLIFSQEAVKKSDSATAGGIYLDASGGVSLPLGSYANADVKNQGSGFASPGFLIQVNLDWTGKGNFGIGLEYTFQYNPLKSSVKNDTLSGMGQAIGTGAWTNHYLMPGVVFVKFFHKLYIEGKAMIGIVISSSPVFKTVDPVYHTPSTNSGTGLAWGIQAGAGYAVSPRVTVKASVEYGAQPSGVDSLTGAIIYSAPINMETKRTVSALLIKAGVVVKLSK